jgi:hypothetical protein
MPFLTLVGIIIASKRGADVLFFSAQIIIKIALVSLLILSSFILYLIG